MRSSGERLPSLFSTTDNQYHADLRRCVDGALFMNSLVHYEPSVDIITEKFLNRTEALFSSRNAVCDFAEWLQFFAFDIIDQIAYSTSKVMALWIAEKTSTAGLTILGICSPTSHRYSSARYMKARISTEQPFTLGWPNSCARPLLSPKPASTLS